MIIDKNNQFIIYGAGRRGISIYKYLVSLGRENLVWGFCDANAVEIGEIEGKKCYTFNELRDTKLPFLIGVTEKYEKEIEQILKASQFYFFGLNELADILGMDRTDFGREYCAYHHILEMDDYFELAETEELLNIFWGKDSLFRKMFEQIDKSKIIELACGRGRHVAQYYESNIEIMLVDILQKNIDICQKRFQNYTNVGYYCNNGYNMQELTSDHYTAVFSYDAMVHFEMWDIYEYLKDIYRVLKKNGMALIHHSNLDWNYRASFAETGRNFMSKNIFAHMAYQIGFKIVEQQIIDWEGIEGLDCVSLIMKL